MRASFRAFIAAIVFCASAPRILSAAELAEPNGETAGAIRAVLDAQVAAWNRGDVDGFMEGYANSETTMFVSGDTATRGWQTVRDRYRAKYDTREKMGTLTFTDIAVKTLGPDMALVSGHWALARTGDQPGGRFTLLFQRNPEGWRIIYDHTSSAEK